MTVPTLSIIVVPPHLYLSRPSAIH
jgi:hypothetical protein